MEKEVTILGAGYVGTHVLKRFPSAAATRRNPSDDPRVRVFQLEDRSSWDGLRLAGRVVVWTFPAQPLAEVQAFYLECLRDAAALIVLGSTSAYVAAPRQDGVRVMDEASPLDATSERVAGEEWLRLRGATVLQLAGIFGPGRRPEEWLRKGRIRDGARLVNLIHVDDIVAVIEQVAAKPLPGVRINVSNGVAMTWGDLVDRYRADGRLPPDFSIPGDGPVHGKRIDTRRLQELMVDHIFRRP